MSYPKWAFLNRSYIFRAFDASGSGVILAKSSSCLSEASEEPETESPNDELCDLETDGLENLAGYIIHKLQYKFPAIKEKYCNNDNDNSWTQLLSEGELQISVQGFVAKLECLNAIFNSYNGNLLKQDQSL